VKDDASGAFDYGSEVWGSRLSDFADNQRVMLIYSKEDFVVCQLLATFGAKAVVEHGHCPCQ